MSPLSLRRRAFQPFSVFGSCFRALNFCQIQENSLPVFMRVLQPASTFCAVSGEGRKRGRGKVGGGGGGGRGAVGEVVVVVVVVVGGGGLEVSSFNLLNIQKAAARVRAPVHSYNYIPSVHRSNLGQTVHIAFGVTPRRVHPSARFPATYTGPSITTLSSSYNLFATGPLHTDRRNAASG